MRSIGSLHLQDSVMNLASIFYTDFTCATCFWYHHHRGHFLRTTFVLQLTTTYKYQVCKTPQHENNSICNSVDKTADSARYDNNKQTVMLISLNLQSPQYNLIFIFFPDSSLVPHQPGASRCNPKFQPSLPQHKWPTHLLIKKLRNSRPTHLG